ncbi:hypothetical protein EJ913_04300 [Azospirillum doebereinerae]|uniref:Uncharacterized protein n=1 Tax=Azospirillum doebereinerae TaxID=92933 RepID=A0A3S0XQD8_9PROT|nr:hypothetical protein EJ913_04300 [Azospirillum doebereinerae]
MPFSPCGRRVGMRGIPPKGGKENECFRPAEAGAPSPQPLSREGRGASLRLCGKGRDRSRSGAFTLRRRA